MSVNCIARRHHIFARVLLIRPQRNFRALALIHRILRVRHARARPKQHRRVELFGNFKRSEREIAAFGTVGRLQHRQLRRARVMARVLLVLRGMHRRIVRHDHHHAAVDSRVRAGKQWIGSNVQTHMLHRRCTACARQRRAERGFVCHLFVRRPFCVNFRIFRCKLGDFRARRARV